MKRYNIHLDPEWMKALDEVIREAQEVWNRRHMWENITRADIIRTGISIVFGLKPTYVHHNPEELTEIVKHVISKRKNRKRAHAR